VALGTPTWRSAVPVLPIASRRSCAGHYICAFSILVEAILSSSRRPAPDIPTWGNVMAEGRAQFNDYPHNIFFPGFFSPSRCAVNILGDGMRDTLDPKMAKRV